MIDAWCRPTRPQFASRTETCDQFSRGPTLRLNTRTVGLSALPSGFLVVKAQIGKDKCSHVG